MRILIISFLIVATVIGNSCVNKIAGKKVEDIPIEPKIHLIDEKDSVHVFVYIESAKVEHERYNFLNNIINIKGELIHSDNDKTSGILFSKPQTRAWKTSKYEYITFVSAGKALGTNKIDLNNYSIKIQIETSDKFYTFEKTCDQIFKEQRYMSGKGLIVVPYFEKYEGESGVFGLFAYRIKQIEEYLPSSEDFRIEIISQKGKTVFNSNKGKAFLTVIKEILPRQVGSMNEYTYPWFGKSNSGSILLKGDYSAWVFIPGVPKSYSKIIKFYWEGYER